MFPEKLLISLNTGCQQQVVKLVLLGLFAAQIGVGGEVEVFGEWVPCTVSAEPLYDPEGARLKS